MSSWFDWMYKPKLEITFIDEITATFELIMICFVGYVAWIYWNHFFGGDE